MQRTKILQEAANSCHQQFVFLMQAKQTVAIKRITRIMTKNYTWFKKKSLIIYISFVSLRDRESVSWLCVFFKWLIMNQHLLIQQQNNTRSSYTKDCNVSAAHFHCGRPTTSSIYATLLLLHNAFVTLPTKRKSVINMIVYVTFQDLLLWIFSL